MTARGPIRTVEMGSVPGTEPGAAVEEAFRLHPSMPSLPEMPRRDLLEGMVPRVLEAFPFVADPVRGSLSVAADDPALVREIERAEPGLPTTRRASALPPFLDRARSSDVAVKASVIGPLALARALVDSRGRRLSDHPRAAEAVALYVARAACAVAEAFLREAPKATVIQLDEPGVTDSLTPDEERLFGFAASEVAARGPEVALHDCGARHGGGLARLAPRVSFVSFDATRAEVPLLDAPAESRSRIGSTRVVWGVVPTDGRPPPAPGFGRDLIRRAESVLGDGPWQSEVWFSPACGLSGLEPAAAARVREALRAIATA